MLCKQSWHLTTESHLSLLTEYDDQKYRVRAIHALVHKLPEKNRTMLDLLTNHLLKYVHINTYCACIDLDIENVYFFTLIFTFRATYFSKKNIYNCHKQWYFSSLLFLLFLSAFLFPMFCFVVGSVAEQHITKHLYRTSICETVNPISACVQ